MPNHCENDLYIEGPQEAVNAFLAEIGADKEQPEFSFDAAIPYPTEYAVRDKDSRELSKDDFKAKYGSTYDGFNTGGYEWRVANWGTKWGAYDVARRDYRGVCVTFRTAWSAPKPSVLAALHIKHPTCSLHLEYFERGQGFCGGYSMLSKDDFYSETEEWKAGVVSNEWSGDYSGRRGG